MHLSAFRVHRHPANLPSRSRRCLKATLSGHRRSSIRPPPVSAFNGPVARLWGMLRRCSQRKGVLLEFRIGRERCRGIRLTVFGHNRGEIWGLVGRAHFLGGILGGTWYSIDVATMLQRRRCANPF